MNHAARPSRSTRRIAALVLIGSLIVATLVGIGITVPVVRRAIHAEQSLHATLFAIRLVDQFVHDKGHWPRSWDELQRLPFPGETPTSLNQGTSPAAIGGFGDARWPQQSHEVREYVAIDFDADLETIISQRPSEFMAIRPIGPCYPWDNYGFIESLQETLAKGRR
jgi:hypothetical protein